VINVACTGLRGNKSRIRLEQRLSGEKKPEARAIAGGAVQAELVVVVSVPSKCAKLDRPTMLGVRGNVANSEGRKNQGKGRDDMGGLSSGSDAR